MPSKTTKPENYPANPEAATPKSSGTPGSPSESSSGNTENDVQLVERAEVREPRRVKVLLHNDDYTTMEFVISILMDIFGKSLQEATQLMLSVHEKGAAICGIYTFELAETKIRLVHMEAKKEGFPLRCTMEDI